MASKRGLGACEFMSRDLNQTFIDSGIAGKLCEPICKFKMFQGPVEGGGFKRGGFPIWISTCSSFFYPFFVLFGTFAIFRDLPDLPGDYLGISRFVPFLFLGLLTAPTRNSPERVRETFRTFQINWETPRFGTPV